MTACDGCANAVLLKLQRAAKPGGSPQRKGQRAKCEGLDPPPETLILLVWAGSEDLHL